MRFIAAMDRRSISDSILSLPLRTKSWIKSTGMAMARPVLAVMSASEMPPARNFGSPVP